MDRSGHRTIKPPDQAKSKLIWGENLSLSSKDLRRDYSAISRTPRYAASEEDEGLRAKVKASVLSLRSSFVSGELDMDGIKFHNLCLKEMEKINNDRPNGSPDRAAFLKGCMYDIADRCLLRFERPSL